MDAYWALLTRQGDAIQEVPPHRWSNADLYDPDPLACGKISTRWAGLIDESLFDAAFFGITDAEVEHMDAQQRIFLEVACEALAHAGCERSSIGGSRTGVYVGVVNYNDGYARRLFSDIERITAFSGPGVSNSVLAGRVSYLLDLKGPSLAIDTACSSSLVAVHQACQSLRNNECDQAIAGGVNLVLSPEFTIATSRMGLMAADGRCKPFDERADGIVRSDGCGAVVLKRLSDAQRDDDRILAVIEATALNQDGRTNGMTAPNGLAQQALLRDLLGRAGVRANQLGYVEAHGTGTRLGDPIEISALATVLSTEPREAPCLVGSAKGNIGHCEAAAGIASLIKAVLCMEHRHVPGQANLKTLNTHIEPSPCVSFARDGQRWPEHDGEPLLGVVSSFGWSGTNAQVLLRAVPQTPVPKTSVYRLAADSAQALIAEVRTARAHVQTLGTDQPVACPVSVPAGAFRKAFTASEPGLLVKEMDRWLSSTPQSVSPARKIALLFSGQGSQWPGMVEDLLSQDPHFRRSLEESQAIIQKLDGWALLPAIAAGAQTDLTQTRLAQPCIVAIQLALFDMLKSWGLEPAAVMGHSVGELSAACCAGILSREQTLQAALARGKCMAQLHDLGSMHAVLAEQDILDSVLGDDPLVSVSACNSPGASIFSVARAALPGFEERCARLGVEPITVNQHYAFHCALLEPVREDLEQAFGTLQHAPAQLEFQSSSHFDDNEASPTEAGYWVRNALRPVRFDRALSLLADKGCDTFIELGPHASLIQHVQRCLGSRVSNLRAWPVLNRHRPAQQTLDTLRAGLFEAGLDLQINTPAARRSHTWHHARFALPAYATKAASGDLCGSMAAQSDTTLDFIVNWRGEDLLADHRVFDTIVVPGAMHLSALLTQALQKRSMSAVRLSDIRFMQPLLLKPGQACQVDFQWRQEEHPGNYHVSVQAHTDHGQRLLSASLLQTIAPYELDHPSLAIPGDEGCELSGQAFYERVHNAGLQLGPLFQRIESMRLDSAQQQILVSLKSPSASAREAGLSVDPGLLDSCFQALYAGYLQRCAELELYIPLAIDELVVVGPMDGRMSATIAMTTLEFDRKSEVLRGDITLHDADGRAVVWLRNAQLKRAARQSLLSDGAAQAPSAYRLGWREYVGVPSSGRLSHIVVGEQPLARYLRTILPNARETLADDVVAQGIPVQWVVTDETLVSSGLDLPALLALKLLQLRDLCVRIDQSGVKGARLCLVTRTADERSVEGSLMAAAALSMLRVIANEYPDIACQAVELPVQWPLASETVDLLVPVLESAALCRVLRIDQGKLYEQYVQPTRTQPGDALAINPSGRYLITGGFSENGTAVMQKLFELGARHISVMGRSRPDEIVLECVEKLKAQGAQVHLFQGDVGNQTDVDALLRQLTRKGQPLQGIVHLAGVVQDALLPRLQTESIESVLRPKLSATLNLLQATQHCALNWFVMCSSLSAHIGLPGQSAYAAANACAEVLMRVRASSVRCRRVIAWGPWAAGMTARLERDQQRRLEAAGLGLMSQAQMLEWLMDGSDDASGDVEIVASLAPGALQRLSGLARPSGSAQQAIMSEQVALTGDDETVRKALTQLVLDELASVSRSIEVGPQTDLADLGMDSLGSVAIVQRLRQRTGRSLPITAFFDSRAVDEVVDKLLASA
ncbi:SDR family NAD(P)-dependent oxidoreductase [Pseudomonas sp. REB1044]|uniref:type I polyketide synthase n=1 Tax=Pseudomonas sp. REB1044 TaxID=2675224 RepID=UPI00315D109F